MPAGEYAASLIGDFEPPASGGLEGRRLGPYEVLRRIGGGGMGVVYEARDTRLDRKVAIKLLPRAGGQDDEARERFIREARAASALDHPNICSIYDVGETGGETGAGPRTFIVMAHYDGETLEQKLEGGPLPANEAGEIAVQVARGLERAHEAGIIHRDVKPANVMITDRGEVKVLDFGIAKVAGDAELTRPGISPGTPAYMSPEQGRGEPVDGRTDVWSLGAILYQMLAGRRPFEGRGEMEIYRAVQNQAPEPLPDRVPADLERVVAKALEKDPEERYLRVGEMLAELEPAVPAAEASGRGGRRATAVAVAAILLAFGGWWATRRGPEVPTPAAEVTVPVVGVMPFVNVSGDGTLDWYGEGIARLVVDGLSSSRHLQVVSPQRTEPLIGVEGSAERAQRAAEDGIGVLVSGEILPATDGLALAARVVRTGDGVQLAGQRLDGLAPEGLLRAADDVVRAARKGLGVPPLEAVNVFAADFTADNPAAYGDYVAGLRAWDDYRFEEAERAFAAALELAPGFTMARYRLALAQMMSGRDDLARSEIARALSEVDGLPDRDARYVRAAGFYITFQDAEAIVAYRQIVERYPYETEARYLLAELLHSSGEYRQELEVLGELAALEPGNSIIWSMTGYAHLALGDSTRAVRDFQRYLELEPGANAYDSLADAYRAQGELERAAEHYAEALRLDPTFHFATVDLAKVDALRGRWRPAEERLAALVNDPEARPRHRRVAVFELAHLYRSGGRFRDAADLLAVHEDLLAAGQARAAWALSLRGTSLMELNQYGEARRLIDRAVALASDDPTRYLFARGLLELRQGRAEDLEATLGLIRQAAAGDPASAAGALKAVAYLRGLQLLAAGRPSAAVGELSQAVSGAGARYRDYRLGLAQAYAAVGRSEAADDVARQVAAERDPADPRLDLELDRVRALLIRARVAAAMGRPSDARRYAGEFLERWSKADPGLAELTEARSLAQARGDRMPAGAS